MIQRIQSVFLFIIAMLMLVILFQPAWKNTGILKKNNERVMIVLDPVNTTINKVSGDGDSVQEDTTDPLNNPSFVEKKGNYYIGGLILLTALNSLFVIFQYKKRMLQVKLSGLNYLLLSGTLVAYYLLIKDLNGLLTDAGKGQFLIGFYVPVIAILINFLVIRFIRKDEALVRSVDRIR